MASDKENPTQNEKEAANQFKTKHLQDNALLTKRREMAQKWQEDHKKNNMLFPASYDYF